MARLLVGYERSHAGEQRLGAERALLGLVVALFHDAGYIRRPTTRIATAPSHAHPRRRGAVAVPGALPADHRHGGLGVGGTQIVHFTATR